MRKDGSTFPVEVQGKSIPHQGRQVRVTAVRDITERNRPEEALRAAEEKFSKAFRSSPDSIVISSFRNGRFIEVNEGFEKISGFHRTEALGKTSLDLGLWVNPAERDKMIRMLKKHGAVRDFQCEFRTKSGDVRLGLFAAEIIEVGGEQCMVAVTRDITESKRAEENLRKTEHRYRDMFQTASVSLWEEDISELKSAIDRLKKQGVTDFQKYFDQRPQFVEKAVQMIKVLDINDDTLRLYGARDKNELLGSLDKIFVPESLPVFREGLIAIAEGKTSFESETVNQTLQGDKIHILMRWAIPQSSKELTSMSVSIMDITERKRAEELVLNIARGVSAATGEMFLRQVVQHLARALGADYAFIAELKPDNPERVRTIAVAANGQETDNFEYDLADTPCENVVGRSICSYERGIQKLFPRDQLLVEMHIEGYAGTPLFHTDGRALGLMVILYCKPISKVTLAESTLQIFAARVSAEVERKQAEEALQKTTTQLRALAAHLQSVREEERTAIAREMHDELGQMLTALKIDLALLERELNGGESEVSKCQDEIKSMRHIIDTTIQTVGVLITELRPEVLDNLGLIAALEWQAEEFKTRTGIACTFKSSIRRIDLSKEAATAIFRIFQETLTNIARHSKATHFDVNISKKNGNLFLRISDNGIGIPADKIENSKTFGLLGMQERAIILGGDVEINGVDGKGTTVAAKIPIN